MRSWIFRRAWRFYVKAKEICRFRKEKQCLETKKKE